MQATSPDRLLRFKEVLQISGIRSRTTLRQHEETGAFPRRVPVGVRSVAWLESDVLAWIAARRRERDDAEAAHVAKSSRDPNAWITAAAERQAQAQRDGDAG